MRQTAIKLGFIGIILALLAAGMVRMFLFPQELNTYENRYNAQVPSFTVSEYLSTGYQDAMEKALADQIPGSQQGKQLYNDVTTAYERIMLRDLLAQAPDRYIHYRGMLIYHSDTFVHEPRRLSEITGELDSRIDNLNSIFAQFPDVAFYVYYIENDTDFNFESGQPVQISSYVTHKLNLPLERIGCFEVESFDRFSEYFYRTDHHWNHAGSYAGYLELCTLLDISEAPMEPLGSFTMQETMTGSRCLETGSDLFRETVTVYEYDWPQMDCRINGEVLPDYGAQMPAAATMADVSYSAIYGSDDGQIILTSGTTGRGTLLLIGDSYDNAVLKLLATHYDSVHAIDLRYYETHLGEPFQLTQYMKSHAIDQVLIIGSGSYFMNSTFNITE